MENSVRAVLAIKALALSTTAFSTDKSTADVGTPSECHPMAQFVEKCSSHDGLKQIGK